MQLTEAELTTMIDRAAREGSRQALRDLGLHDEDAAVDMRDLRDLIRGWRTAKSEAFKAVVKWLATALLLALIAGIGANHFRG